MSARPSVGGEQILCNARIVLRREVVRGSVRVRDARIESIDTGGCAVPGAIDLGGDYLLPGLVEIHTDNLERHMMPRPRTRFPLHPAMLAHDAEIVSAGITTVFDAIGVGDPYGDGFRADDQGPILAVLDELDAAGVLRAEHFVHLRCELPAPNARTLFAPFEDARRVRLISLMDHTIGQRQWTDPAQAKVYYTGKKGWSDDQFEREMRLGAARQRAYAPANRRWFVDFARDRGIALATHDDTTEAHVDEAFGDGATMSEFPTTEAAARRAKALGMATVAGAPNVVRGGSHSGNVSAAHLAQAGLLDILSSDYVPTSLINAAWQLRGASGERLPEAVALVSANVADATGLVDRGEIVAGRRADLVRVREVGGRPAVGDVWVAGRRVH